MKLSTKIACVMGVLFACISMVSYVSMQRLYSINRIYDEATQTGFPLTSSTQNLMIMLADYRRSELNTVLRAEPVARENAGRSLEELQAAIVGTIEKYRAHAIGEPRLVQANEIERMWKEYVQTSEEVRRLAASKKVAEALMLLNSRSADRYNTLYQVLGKLATANTLFSENALLKGDALYQQSQLLLFALIAFTLVFTCGSGIYMVRTVLRTLGKNPDDLQQFARRVANGELSVEKDEQASGVYRDILRMVAVLRAQAVRQETLVDNIPGGVLRTLRDNFGTITYSSEGFETLTGYSHDETAVLFDNHFITMIVAEDRFPCVQRVREQLEKSSRYQVEYRLRHKDGQEVWVLDRGRKVEEDGLGMVYRVLIDVSQVKHAQERLKTQEERLRTVLAISNDMVWEGDSNAMFRFIKGADYWMQLVGAYPKNYDDSVRLALPLCHPDDIDDFQRTFAPQFVARAIHDGATSLRLEFRISNYRTKEYTWFQCVLVPFLDMYGGIERIMACSVNINDRKNREYKILSSARRDPLTNLYNKGFTEEKIVHMLANEAKDGNHALFIMDIDGFKAVNDNLGHLVGDGLLTDIARDIGRLFRARDVVGRIGGDEFMVFMENVQGDDFLLKKSAEVCAAFRRTICGEYNKYAISGSVGVARYPQDGTTYRDLYRRADLALYDVKRNGKDNVRLFDLHLEEEGERTPMPARELTGMVQRAEQTAFKDNIMAYIFELLYEARDIGTVINISLGMIGKHYGVSRAYILQKNTDNNTLSNTYEWCNTGIPSEKKNLQNLAQDEIGGYLDQFTHDGAFYCTDTSTLDPVLFGILNQQGIKALLHLAIYENGEFRGCVGFDDCTDNRTWTREEVSVLSMLAKILGVFLLKDNMARKLEEAYSNIITILDSMNIFAYVCDEDTYVLEYLNAKIRDQFPESRLGMTCHAAFFDGRETPCEQCPRASLPTGTHFDESFRSPLCSMEIYNPVLEVWTQTTASRIPWSGKNAVLICCVDVTAYKKSS